MPYFAGNLSINRGRHTAAPFYEVKCFEQTKYRMPGLRQRILLLSGQ